MGAIFFLYTSMNSPLCKQINSSTIQNIMNLKPFGEDWSDVEFKNSPNIGAIDKNNLMRVLTKKQISEYKQKLLIYGIHQKFINDLSANSKQPFVCPLYNMNPKRTDPDKIMISTGEIYNYNDFVNNFNLTNLLSSTSDVEIFLPIYNSTNNFDFLKDVDGEYNFLITENINTEIDTNLWNIFAARDIMGIRNCHVLTNSNNDVIITSNLRGVEKNILQLFTNIQEIKPGHYWSLSTLSQIPYFDYQHFKSQCVVSFDNFSPNDLDTLYCIIRTTLYDAIISRFTHSLKQVCILFSSGLFSSIIVYCIFDFISKNTEYSFDNVKILIHVNQGVNDFCYEGFFQKMEKKYNTKINKHVVTSNNTFEQDLPSILSSLENQVFISGFGLKYMFCENIDFIFNLYKTFLNNYDQVAGFSNSEIRYPFLKLDVVKLMYSISNNLKKSLPYYVDGKTYNEDKYIIRKSFSDLCD